MNWQGEFRRIGIRNEEYRLRKLDIDLLVIRVCEEDWCTHRSARYYHIPMLYLRHVAFVLKTKGQLLTVGYRQFTVGIQVLLDKQF